MSIKFDYVTNLSVYLIILLLNHSGWLAYMRAYGYAVGITQIPFKR